MFRTLHNSEPGLPVISPLAADRPSRDLEDPEESARTRRTNKQNGDYYGDDFEENN